MSKLSPMLQQYLDIKAAHKDCVLFFRLGDFYEMFFEDAINISKELELTLTGRDCGLPERAPMCGIPYHAADGYIKKLIEKGYKVAICEQLEDPQLAKGLVKRDVIRIVTPGTVIENNLLNEGKNNYIASLIIKGKMFSICFADISTGDVYLTTQKAQNISIEVINEFSKFVPSEILFNDEMLKYNDIGDFIKNKLSCVCELYDEDTLQQDKCVKTIVSHFKSKTIDQLGIGEDLIAQQTLSGLIEYVSSTQKDGAKRIVDVNLYQQNEYMSVDITARRNLEITETMRSQEKRGTLLWVLDKTKTAMGKRYMRKSLEQPLLNVAEITKRQSAIDELINKTQQKDEIIKLLSNVYDLERLMTRVIYGSATPREIKSLGFTISFLPELKSELSSFNSKFLTDVYNKINTLEDVSKLIDKALNDELPMTLKDGGIIKDGFSADLDEYRDLCKNAKGYIAKIEEAEREKTGIKNLKIGYNRVFGYYIEITKSNIGQAPETYIRKQTLTNCERYITQELKDLETKVLTANDKITALESEIFDEVRKFVASKIDLIQQTATAIARLDFIVSLATVAKDNNYVKPSITIDGAIMIKDGRHPVVEAMQRDCLFVPNDTLLDTEKNKVMIITGPNMAGKSTYMRQVAVITIMAQIGSFVPASSANISICDKIFTRVGASDDLSAGQSTFMVEMSEVAHILKNATKQSLVILDEIGRGTSTFDGMSIAKSVITYILTNKRLGCKTLFATHYHELTDLEKEYDDIRNYNIAVKKRGDDITFLRKIVEGGADESYGIEVAKLAGVPDAVVDNAKQYLSELNESYSPHIVNNNEFNEESTVSQISFTQNNNEKIVNKLKAVQLETLTPIEALNELYELKKMILD